MRVFISFAHDDANLAAQLEAALRRNNIRGGLDTSNRQKERQRRRLRLPARRR
jgi:hypothetical protein